MIQQESIHDRGLPASIDAERAILGAVLLDNAAWNQAEEKLRADDFSLDSHRRIYLRMGELSEQNRPIDFVTLAEQLMQKRELEAIGGIQYLTSLTDGLPRVKNIEEYVSIVKDKAVLRGLIHAASNAVQMAYDQAEPCADIVAQAEAAIFEIAEQRITSGLQSIPEIVKGSFGTVEQLYERGQRITGLETHFSDLDDMTSGLQKKELIIVAARPSQGKTAFCVNIAENVAIKDGKVVAVFSLEMGRESLLLRMLCSQARIDSHKMRTGFINREELGKIRDALGVLVDAPLFIDDTPGIALSELRAKARRLRQSQGRLDLIIVDYLQLMSGGKKFGNRQEEVSFLSRGLKGLAKDLNCPVIALSQLSRAPENRTGNNRPQLADLRESGAIEQDADVVAFIFREELYKKDDPDLEGKAELILGKNRNGPVGTVHLAFIKRSTRFDNLASESYASRDDFRRTSEY